ncbi:MAG: NUDIX domain-containing protein [Clostridiales bacterium]|nr:NUDIX domain-containing protein [Clostridiales bacterium]
MIYEKSCGAIVYTNVNGERLYLVEQMLGGHWGVPKGHVEENETEEETALREIKEEVGLDVIIDSGFRTVETYSPKDGFIKDVVYFVAYSKSMDTTMQAEEVRDIKWVKIKEATDLIEFQDMQEIMIMADTYLGKTN